MTLKFQGICWKLRLQAKRTQYFVTIMKEIVLGNALRKGDYVFSYLVEFKGKKAILNVFEPLDEVTYFLIKTDILKTLYKYFRVVKVLTVAVGSTEQQSDRGELIIKLTLQLVNDDKDIFDIEVNIN